MNNMRKIFILLVAMLFCTAIAKAQTLYSTDFATEEEFDKWLVIDANGDDAKWSFDSNTTPSVFYAYNSKNAADDWFISPAIVSEKAGNIVVSIQVKGSSYGEKLELFMGGGNNVEDMTTRLSETLYLKDEITDDVFIAQVEANTPFHIGFHAISDADKWRLYLCDITVRCVDKPVDLQVTNIVSPVSDNNLSQEEITIEVKNNGSQSVDFFDVSYSVNDGEVVTETVNQTLTAGGIIEHTFTTKADLSASREFYTIKAWVNHPDDIRSLNNMTSANVLHKAPATLPYFMGFENDEYTGDITFWNLNDDDRKWKIYSDPWWNPAHTGEKCLLYNYSADNDASDWAILEPITIPEAGYYVLKFWYSGDDGYAEKFGVYYGEMGDPSAMTNKIVEYAPFARSSYEESINIIYIDNPMDIYIGFYAFSDKDCNLFSIDDISLEKVDSETIDLMALPVTTPLDYVHKGTEKDICFKVRNLSPKEAYATVRATMSDNVIYEENIVLPGLEIKDVVMQNALKDLTAGLYTVNIEIVSTEDIDTENNSISHTFHVMDAPTALWDFENGEVPSEFTFFVEDYGTVNPGAGSEFNEYGWGIFNIQEHELYGNHTFAGTSWLDNTEKADRWCILPPFKASEESFMVWDAASYNQYYLETYSIMISTNGNDDTSYYFTEEGYVMESTDFKTRGIDLREYAGKEISIAFRLSSKNCEHLVLDNIALYGGSMVEPLDVKATATPTEGIIEKLDNFTIEFENVESVSFEYYPSINSYIASVGEGGSLTHLADVTPSVIEGEPTKINLSIAQGDMTEITEDGMYALVVPLKEFYFNGEKRYTKVDELVFYYEISNAEVQYQISVAPVSGSDIAMDELSEITVTFDGVQNILLNDENQHCYIQRLDNSDMVIEELSVQCSMISDVAYKVTINTLPTELGKYRLVIPETMVKIEDNAGVQGYNKYFTADFNVVTYTNIGDIVKEGTEFNVYDVNGVQILHNVKEEELKLLQNGIYIVNGKKMLIK